MKAVAAVFACCLLTSAIAPARGAGILVVRGDIDEAPRPAGLNRSVGLDEAGQLSTSQTDPPGEWPHRAPSNRLYVLTGLKLQQSALCGTISGLNIGTRHTISLGWATRRPDDAAAVPIAFWGLAFNVRTFAVRQDDATAESFTPWMQQRFGRRLEGGARVLPIPQVDTNDAESAAERPGAAPTQSEAGLIWSGERGEAPDYSTVALVVTILAFFALLGWTINRAARQNVLEAQVSLARRSPRHDTLRSADMLEELAPEWR